MLLASSDLAAGADEATARLGLVPLEGGRHPGWGTANRIVPLGDTYLELVAVVDDAEAGASSFGRWVMSAGAPLLHPLGWAVRTRVLDLVADRLRLDIRAGSRVTPTGERLRWRSAGIEQAAACPLLPFFIEWLEGAAHPGRSAVTATDAVAISTISVSGNADLLAGWLGPHELPITVEPGLPALAAVVVSTPRGDVTLGGGRPRPSGCDMPAQPWHTHRVTPTLED